MVHRAIVLLDKLRTEFRSYFNGSEAADAIYNYEKETVLLL